MDIHKHQWHQKALPSLVIWITWLRPPWKCHRHQNCPRAAPVQPQNRAPRPSQLKPRPRPSQLNQLWRHRSHRHPQPPLRARTPQRLQPLPPQLLQGHRRGLPGLTSHQSRKGTCIAMGPIGGHFSLSNGGVKTLPNCLLAIYIYIIYVYVCFFISGGYGGLVTLTLSLSHICHHDLWKLIYEFRMVSNRT